MQTTPPLYLKKLKGKGRGVFCRLPLAAETLIEECPVILVPADQSERVRQSTLSDYLFRYDPEGKSVTLAMGFGSLYNHARDSNAYYHLDQETLLLRIIALRAIRAHEEICINYGGEHGKDYSEWFRARGIRYIE